MGLDQAHPGGVFQILETEALLKFHSIAKKMAVTCPLAAAIVWHDEPLRLCTCPPTTTHFIAYVAERGTCPSSAQTLTPGRKVVYQLPQ